MNFWDQQFGSDEFKYGKQPNAFLVEQAGLFAPHSNILVPGDGEGRNSVWLARQGHQVLAVDASVVGLSKARKLAAECGVTIATKHADLQHWMPSKCYDAVVLTYVHLPAECRQAIHQNLARALRPGGVLVLEAFSPDQLAKTSGGPKILNYCIRSSSYETISAAFCKKCMESSAKSTWTKVLVTTGPRALRAISANGSKPTSFE
ncbi:class I SAM-dependent methyltransferase [Neopusillimonas aromaticivorans]|uniref:class I SAM-dependent methyltransferase n=1 Tax=Neopusillimonas aromaticivorans TaxID=2979868 RepID=UPI0025948543|nr:class I SAM-dependent methyltransferase [Neopusillimonas aromaticivorans]WJJ92693.1 class I SAM-dependent methyltransferase [Neopusillimonas aromaticivorans]